MLKIPALTERELAALLRDAEKAHGEYEKTLSGRDDDWAAWYAHYILTTVKSDL